MAQSLRDGAEAGAGLARVTIQRAGGAASFGFFVTVQHLYYRYSTKGLGLETSRPAARDGTGWDGWADLNRTGSEMVRRLGGGHRSGWSPSLLVLHTHPLVTN